MKTITMVFVAALALSLGTQAAEQKTDAKKPAEKQTHCPVMQRYEIDGTLYIDVKGKRVYTCCKGCQNQIKANPDKYIKRLTDAGVIIEDAPKPKDQKTK